MKACADISAIIVLQSIVSRFLLLKKNILIQFLFCLFLVLNFFLRNTFLKERKIPQESFKKNVQFCFNIFQPLDKGKFSFAHTHLYSIAAAQEAKHQITKLKCAKNKCDFWKVNARFLSAMTPSNRCQVCD